MPREGKTRYGPDESGPNGPDAGVSDASFHRARPAACNAVKGILVAGSAIFTGREATAKRPSEVRWPRVFAPPLTMVGRRTGSLHVFPSPDGSKSGRKIRREIMRHQYSVTLPSTPA